jgi:hypothetical protein
MAGSEAGPIGNPSGSVDALPVHSGKLVLERFDAQASTPPLTSKALKEEYL